MNAIGVPSPKSSVNFWLHGFDGGMMPPRAMMAEGVMAHVIPYAFIALVSCEKGQVKRVSDFHAKNELL